MRPDGSRTFRRRTPAGRESAAADGMRRADDEFEHLYRRHRGEVYAFVLRRVRCREEAEDITQGAFLDAYGALRRGARPRRPTAWLFAIAANAVRRRFRTS